MLTIDIKRTKIINMKNIRTRKLDAEELMPKIADAEFKFEVRKIKANIKSKMQIIEENHSAGFLREVTHDRAALSAGIPCGHLRREDLLQEVGHRLRASILVRHGVRI